MDIKAVRIVPFLAPYTRIIFLLIFYLFRRLLSCRGQTVMH